ncbi:MAG: hypothetical protein D6723_07760 [Acidobacteria bacterium]|nr:MAG: hypothetical protein D6723_07760 [Acidobacteriota bacterium]
MSVVQESPFRSSNPARPGPLGRGGRILFGFFLAWYAARFLGAWLSAIQQDGLVIDRLAYTPVVQKGNFALYALTLLCVVAMPVATLRHRLVGMGILLLVILGIDYVLVGDWWGLPLAAMLSLIIVATVAFFALAHIVAGIIAHPG